MADDNVSLEFLQRRVKELEAEKQPTLHSGGGGGTFSDDMEARVKRLEEDAKDVRGDLKAIRLDLAEMKGRLQAMPTTWQMVGFIVACAIAMFTVVRFALPGG